MTDINKPELKFVPTSNKIVLTITMDSAGSVQVNGPINDQILCYGLLEVARQLISKHIEQMHKQILVVRPAVKV